MGYLGGEVLPIKAYYKLEASLFSERVLEPARGDVKVSVTVLVKLHNT